MEDLNLWEKPQLVYVMDPMCSWCYGFAPVLKRVLEEYKNKVDIKFVMGGLRPGTTSVMDEEAKAAMRQHWQDVEAVTGQPFDYSFFDRDAFVYDTAPACRAVVTMRYLKPDDELAMAEELQQAFYAKNQDITAPAVLATIAAAVFGVEEEAFLEKYNSEEMEEKTKQDFLIARHLQATAFPSLYLLNADKVYLLFRGYRLYEAVKARVEEAIYMLNHPQ